MPRTIALGLTHPGTVRNRNESAFYLMDTLVPGEPSALAAHALHAGQPVQFYAVAAGIGGHDIGDTAARLALTELQHAGRKVRDPARFDFFAFGRAYLQQADKAVRRMLQNRADVYAGASLAMLCLAGDSAYVLSCGDCRCYRLRGGELTRLTDDDERSDKPPRRLTGFLGRLDTGLPDQEPRLRQFPLEAEDVFLLANHGLTSLIQDEALAERLNAPETFTAKPEHLLREALAAEARENIAFVLLRVLDRLPAEADLLPEPQFPRHRVRPPFRVNGSLLRTGLILLASLAFGFLAGWVLLTLIF